MSDLWVGVFVGIAVWNVVNAVLALALVGQEMMIDYQNVGISTVFALVSMFAGFLIYVGVI